MTTPRFGVVQGGARMHYAVPRIFEEAGILSRLYTDAVGNKDFPGWLQRLWPPALQPASARALFSRIPQGIPVGKMTTFPWLGFSRFFMYQTSPSLAHAMRGHMRFHERLAQGVIENLTDDINALYLIEPMVPLLREAKRRGIRTIIEQANAPAPIIVKILGKESETYAEIAQDHYDDPVWADYTKLEQTEWDLADQIVCGSEFVLDGIREVGGPVHKVTVVPYGVNQQSIQRPRRDYQRDGFHVIFVGRVDLRKGAHYLLEAARRLENSDVQFRFVGAVHLSQEIQANAPRNVQFIGRLPRPEVLQQYRWADAFCLPSLCEGSATVTYEAMAMGLPVIATPNTGSIVQEGVNGYIIPIRDPEAIVQAIKTCRERLALGTGDFPDNRGDPPPYSFEAYRQRLLAACCPEMATV